MNTFGLGLVLNFTDNATQGIQRVTQAYAAMENSFNNGVNSSSEAFASQVGMNLYRLGDSLISVGDSITDVFTGLVDKIKTVGSDFESFRITLGAVYKDAGIVQEKIDQLLSFSKKSPFEIQDTKDMLLVLKAAGIDAFEELTNASDGFSQQALSWVTDIMAFKPDIPVERWKLALTNFLGSGEAKVLRNILDSGKIQDIIGRDIADTVEGRMQDLMDVISNLGLENLTNKLFGTMEQQASNLGDVFTELYLRIADNGAFNSLKNMQRNLISILTGDEMSNSMETISQSISDAIVNILSPVEKLTEKIHDLGVAVVDIVSKHPKIMTIGLTLITITGSAIALLGVVVKLGGAFTSFLASIKYLSGGASILSMLRIGLWNILKVVGPLSAAAFILYKVWDSNISNIQDRVSNFVSYVVDTVSLIWDAFKDNELSVENFEKARTMGILPLIEAILQVKYHWGFLVSGFKKGLDAFFESLSNVLVKLGILDVSVSGFGDLITALLEKITAPGLTDTWEKVGYLLGEAVGWILVAIALIPVVIKGVKIIASVMNIVVTLISAIVTVLKPIWSVIKFIVGVLKLAFTIVRSIVQLISIIPWGTVLSGVRSVLVALGKVFVYVLTGIGTVVSAILGACGVIVTLPAWLVGLIVAAIAAAVVAVIAFWDEIKAFFIKIGNIIAGAFIRAWEWFSNLPWVQSVIGFVTNIILVVKGAISTIIASVIGFVTKIIGALMRIMTPVINIVRTIISTVVSIAQSVWSIIKSVASVIATVFMGIIDIVKTVASAVWSVLKSVFNVIKSVAMGAWNIIKSVANFVVQIFRVIYQVIRTIVLSAIWVFQQLWVAISTGLNFIYNLFSTIFNWIYSNIIEPVITAIGSAFSWLYDNVISPVVNAIGTAFDWLNTNVIQPFCTLFVEAFNTISDRVDKFCDTVKSVFTTVKDWICDSIQTATATVVALIAFWDEIKTFFIKIGNAIAEAFTSAWECFSSLPWVQGVIGFVQGIIQNVRQAVSTVVNIVKGVISSIINALMPIITPIVNIIKTITVIIISIGQSVWSIIKSIASAISKVIIGIVDIIKPVASAIWQVVQSIFNVIKSVVMGIWHIIKSIANFIMQIFNVIYQAIRVVVLSIIWVFQQLWDLICTGLSYVGGFFSTIFNAIYQAIRVIVLGITWVFQQLWDSICTGLSYVGDFFSTIFNWIYSNVIEPIVNAIGAAFDWVYNNVISPVISAIGAAFDWLYTNVIEPICGFFKAAFDKVADVVDTLVDKFTTAFTTIKDWICDSIQTAADVVTPIIDKISSAISFVAEGLSSIIDAASGALSWVGDKVESAGDYVSKAVGLSTGGYVKTEGIAMLHPNEVVVNDVLTRGLGSFLADYNRAKVTSSPLIQQDIVATDDYSEDDNPITPKPVYVGDPDTNNDDNDSPMRSIVNNSTTYNQEDNSKKDNISQDNSVTFEAGSVVIQIDKDTDLSDEGLDLLVDKLMKKMARKVQLRNMQTRA